MVDYASNLIAALRGAAPEASDNPGINYFTPPPPATAVSNWRASTSRPSGGNAFDPRILALRADALPNTTTAAKDPFAALRAGGVTGGGSYSSGSSYRPSEPSAWSQMSEQEQAQWYRDNPTAGDIAGLGLDLFSYTLPGQVLGYFNPEGMYRAQAVTRGFSPTEGWNQTNKYSDDMAALNAKAQAEAQAQAAAQAAAEMAAKAAPVPAPPPAVVIPDWNPTPYSGSYSSYGGWSGMSYGGSDGGGGSPSYGSGGFL